MQRANPAEAAQPPVGRDVLPARLKSEVAALAESRAFQAEHGLSARQARRRAARVLEDAGAQFVESGGKRYAVIPKTRSAAVSASQRGVGSREQGRKATKRAQRQARKAARPWRR